MIQVNWLRAEAAGGAMNSRGAFGNQDLYLGTLYVGKLTLDSFLSLDASVSGPRQGTSNLLPFGSSRALRPFFFNRMANECFQQLPAPRGLGPSEERFATYIAPRRLRGCRRADRCRCRRQRTGSRHWRRLLSSTAYGRLIQINYLRRRRVECSIRQGRTSLIREKCNDPVDSCGGGLGVGIISSGRSPCASSSAG